MDNIKGECGRVVNYAGCSDYQDSHLHHPQTHQVKESYGLNLNFHWDWPWKEGEDEVACITTAVKKGTCYGGITFQNGKCWKRS